MKNIIITTTLIIQVMIGIGYSSCSSDGKNDTDHEYCEMERREQNARTAELNNFFATFLNIFH
jgi:phage-related protein